MPPSTPKRISIVEVARAAQVSIGTVSRVINGHSAVLPANAAAVRRAMEALAYHPPAPENRRGRRRRAETAMRVSLLLMGPNDLSWITDRSPVYAHVVHGVQAALADHRIDLVVRHVPRFADLGPVLRQQPPDGVILFGAEPDDAPPEELARLPAVWVMGSPRRFRGDHVLPNHRRIGLLAAEYLLAAGHRVCAFLGWDLTRATPFVNDGTQRGLACQAAFAAAGGRMLALAQDGLYDHQRNRTNEGILAQRLDEVFAAEQPPTALFLGMDAYAPSVYRHLQRRSLQPGRDVGIITCNGEQPFLAGLDPAPAVIDIHAAHIGRRAVERLRWRIAHPSEPAEEILVAPSLAPD
jgi:DNA-binding LacI/PurR family transcriptional regulator